MAVDKTNRTTLTQAELAGALGVSQPMVSKLAKQGMPLDEGIDAAKAWRKAHLDTRYTKDRRRMRARTPAADPDTPTWRDRGDRASALIRETELERLQGGMIPAKGLLRFLQGKFSIVGQRVQGVLPRVLAQLPQEWRPVVGAALEDAIHEALMEISGLKAEELDALAAPVRKRNGSG